jgi:hypothetical protein
VHRVRLATWLRTTVAGGIVVCLAAATAAAPVARAGSTASSKVLSSHLRLRVTTSSDWTQLHISPGVVVAERLLSHNGTGSYTAENDGLALQGMSGPSTFIVDLVLYDPSPSTSYTVTLCKGYLGTTTVDMTNRNASTPAVVGRFSDSVHSLTDGTNPSRFTVSRGALMTAVPMPVPHADRRRLVLAFYYPWFPNYSDPQLADRPVKPRSAQDRAGVAAMTRQAKRHGIDGFVVSWMGQQQNGAAFDLAVRAAEAHRQKITGYLETTRATSDTSLGQPDPGVVRQWLSELLQRSSSPSFLRADGGPVVFVYTMQGLSAQQWGKILSAIDQKFQTTVHLVGDASDPAYASVEYGVHRYADMSRPSALKSWSRTTSLDLRARAVLNPRVDPRLFVGTVQPGFDDRRLRGDTNPVIRRRHGARYDRTWSAALAGSPDWIVVTSWNEWYEDTQVEPGVKTGGRALRQTDSWSWKFKHRAGA